MIDLFDYTSLALEGLTRTGVAGRVRPSVASDVVAFGPIRPSRNGGSLLAASLKRQIGGLNGFLDAAEAAFAPLGRALDSANTLLGRLSSLKSLATQAGAIGFPAPPSAPVSALASKSLAPDGVVEVTGAIGLAGEAAVDVSGNTALADDAPANVTGSKDVGSSLLLTLDAGVGLFETLTIDIGGDVTTLTFGLLPGQIITAAQLETELDAIDGIEASYDQNGYLVLTGEDAKTSFTVGGTADIEAALGIAEQTYAPTNLLSQGLAQGETLTFQVGDGEIQTIAFGTGPGEVATLAELDAALAGLDGLDASLDASNRLAFTATDSGGTVTVGGSADVEAAFGVAEQTYYPTNLLSQGLAQGETLTFQVGGGGIQTIAFGTGPGEVATLAELDAALAGLEGVDASLDASNRLAFTAVDSGETVTVGGSADVEAAFGVAEQTYYPTNLLGQGLAQGETLTFQVGDGEIQTIAFGTASGEVSTLAELKAALAGLEGLDASLDASNRLVFAAVDAGDGVTVGGSAGIEAVFGLVPGTLAPDVSEAESAAAARAALEGDFKDLALRIDGLVSAAGLGGVNLLAGDQYAVPLSGRGADGAYTVSGRALSAAALGLGGIGEVGFQDAAAIDDALAAVETAVGRVTGAIAVLESHRDALAIRTDFSRDLNNLLGGVLADLELTKLDGVDAKKLALETKSRIAALVHGDLVEKTDPIRAANARGEDLEKPLLSNLIGEPDLAKSLLGALGDTGDSLLARTLGFA